MKKLLNTTYFTGILNAVQLVWRANRKFFIGMMALALLNGLYPVAFITINAAILDTLVQAVTGQGVAVLRPLLLLLLAQGVIVLVERFIVSAMNTLQEIYQLAVSNDIQLRLTRQAASLDLAYFENPVFHNQMTQATQEASYRPMMIVQGLFALLSGLVTLFSVTSILLLWQAWTVPVILSAAFLSFWGQKRFSQARAQLYVQVTPTQRKADYLRSILTADWTAQEIRLFDLGAHFVNQLKQQLQIIYHKKMTLNRRYLFIITGLGLIVAISQPLLIGFVGWQVIIGVLSVGQFSLYSGSLIQLRSNFDQVMQTLAQLHEHNLFVAHLFNFLALQPDVEASGARTVGSVPPIAKTTPQVVFENVSFQYPGTNRAVLQDISFSLTPGESIALVGNNGAGKSTIVKLLAGLYHPTSGRILFDGVDITTVDRGWLREHLGVILQQYNIYYLSAYDNIGLGDVSQIDNRTRIEAMSHLSGFDSVAQTLPDGYETILGRFFERGHELSGGQRQLVALTRALMRRAPILVLDEPSAALDVQKERHFFKTILAQYKNAQQSILFISHRFASVREADRILVLDQGQLIEDGSHDALLARQGHYAQMYALQMETYTQKSFLPQKNGHHQHLALKV